jgi:hypothetical protein
MPSLDRLASPRLFVSRCNQEWRSQLRSSLHPRLFAVVYRVAAALADLCGLNLPARAELLLAAPKVAQSIFAALLDCYTWKLAEKAYGRQSRAALAAVGPSSNDNKSAQVSDPALFSLYCPCAARGSGSAQLGPCQTASKRPLQPSLSTFGLGIVQVL